MKGGDGPPGAGSPPEVRCEEQGGHADGFMLPRVSQAGAWGSWRGVQSPDHLRNTAVGSTEGRAAVWRESEANL